MIGANQETDRTRTGFTREEALAILEAVSFPADSADSSSSSDLEGSEIAKLLRAAFTKNLAPDPLNTKNPINPFAFGFDNNFSRSVAQYDSYSAEMMSIINESLKLKGKSPAEKIDFVLKNVANLLFDGKGEFKPAILHLCKGFMEKYNERVSDTFFKMEFFSAVNTWLSQGIFNAVEIIQPQELGVWRNAYSVLSRETDSRKDEIRAAYFPVLGEGETLSLENGTNLIKEPLAKLFSKWQSKITWLLLIFIKKS